MKTKKENMTLNDSLLILAKIYFYENDTNDKKCTYHDDCLEKKKQKKKKNKKKKNKKKKNNIFCILNWGMAVSCSRNMNLVKCRESETSEEKSFQCLIFFCIFAHFCIWAFFADQAELTKQIPPPLYSYFSSSDPLTQQ